MTISPISLDAVRIGLFEAFVRTTFFNIVGITNAARALGKPIYDHTDDWRDLQVAHCLHWDVMSEATPALIVQAVERILGLHIDGQVNQEDGPGYLSDLSFIFPEPTSVPPTPVVEAVPEHPDWELVSTAVESEE